MRHISIKTICVALGIALFVILIIFAGTMVYYRWASVQYFGKVSEIKNGGFLIQTDSGVKKLVATNPDTVIRKGRHSVVGSLQVGDYVIVVGAPDGDIIKAEMIRVVNVAPLPRK